MFQADPLVSDKAINVSTKGGIQIQQERNVVYFMQCFQLDSDRTPCLFELIFPINSENQGK